MMNSLVVGVGDVQVSRARRGVGLEAAADGRENAPGSVTLITYALGSCIGVTVYDPVAEVGGMLHYMLPDSALDPKRAEERPAMFADVGIPLLFRSCYKLGAEKQRMLVYGAGGAQVSGACDPFGIGKRNQLALKKILWKAGVILRGESLGGSLSRTVRLDLGTGQVSLRMGADPDQCVYDPCTREAGRPAGAAARTAGKEAGGSGPSAAAGMGLPAALSAVRPQGSQSACAGAPMTKQSMRQS